MPRATNAVARTRRRNRILKKVKGAWCRRSKLMKVAKETLNRAEAFAFRGRREKKRVFRSLWILRLNAAARQEGLTYHSLISGLKKAGVTLDRKALAELAVNDEKAFVKLAGMAKAQLS